MDFRTYLRNLVVIPKTGFETSKEDFNYPEKTIGFLNQIRDHYTKYHTTYALFYPSLQATMSLVEGGSVNALEAASNNFNSSFPPPPVPLAAFLELPATLRNFLCLTTLGFITNSQTMNTGNGVKFIGSELDKQIMVNRVLAKGSPAWWSEINGTSVVNTSTMPTGTDVVGIINEILLEAYEYYNTLVVTAPTVGDLYSITPSAYWISNIVKKLNANPTVSIAYLKNVMSETLFQNFFSSRSVVADCIKNGTSDLFSLVSARKPAGAKASGMSLPVDSEYYKNFPVNDEFVMKFLAIFGDWFECKTVDTVTNYNISYFVDGFDKPVLETSPTNKGRGVYKSNTNGVQSEYGTCDYFIGEDQKLTIVDVESGSLLLVPNFYKINGNTIILFQTEKQNILFRKSNGSIINGGNINSQSWFFQLITKVELVLNNSWLNTDVVISPYVKFFTSGKVTLDYLKSIQVRDVIAKSDDGKDLYLFPAFLIYSRALLTEDPYNPANYRINSTEIKAQIASAITYIESQLFAQDIATLVKFTGRFYQATEVNDKALLKLADERLKLKAIDTNLKNTLLEAKKLYDVYNVLKANFEGRPDPVAAYRDEIQSKMDSELQTFATQEATRISNEKQLKAQAEMEAFLAEEKRKADENAAQQAAQLELARLAQIKLAEEQAAAVEAQRLEDLRIAKLKADAEELERLNKEEQERQAAIALAQKAQALEDSKTTTVTTSMTDKANSTTDNTASTKTSSKALPIVGGLGVLAWLMLGSKE